MKKLISVIIPTHNRADFIEDAINSVLSQKLPKNYGMEVIVIDDGSTDNTKDIVKKFKNKITFKYITASGRPAVPRNIGIGMAKGELIAFQDSDDLWVKDKLIKQLPAFNDPNVVLCYGNGEIITMDGKKTGKTIIEPKMGKSGRVFEELLRNNFISTLTVLAKKSAIEQVGGFDESPNLRGVEDYNLWLRMSRIGSFSFVNDILSLYRKHDMNISNDIASGFNEHILATYSSIMEQPLTKSENKAVNREMAHILSLNLSRSTGYQRIKFTINMWRHKVLSKV